MTEDEYLTIVEPGHAQTRVLGSRFFGTALSTDSEERLERQLSLERGTRHDATHWCFAARFNAVSGLIERCSDAGEPKGTAGAPILQEIRARKLLNASVIVTRYFGGTKLGTGNLARAYAECASQALAQAKTALRYMLGTVVVECPFDLQSLVYRAARKFDASIESQPQAGGTAFTIRVRAGAVGPLCATLGDEGRGRVNVVSRDP